MFYISQSLVLYFNGTYVHDPYPSTIADSYSACQIILYIRAIPSLIWVKINNYMPQCHVIALQK